MVKQGLYEPMELSIHTACPAQDRHQNVETLEQIRARIAKATKGELPSVVIVAHGFPGGCGERSASANNGMAASQDVYSFRFLLIEQ